MDALKRNDTAGFKERKANNLIGQDNCDLLITEDHQTHQLLHERNLDMRLR